MPPPPPDAPPPRAETPPPCGVSAEQPLDGDLFCDAGAAAQPQLSLAPLAPPLQPATPVQPATPATPMTPLGSSPGSGADSPASGAWAPNATRGAIPAFSPAASPLYGHVSGGDPFGFVAAPLPPTPTVEALAEEKEDEFGDFDSAPPTPLAPCDASPPAMPPPPPPPPPLERDLSAPLDLGMFGEEGGAAEAQDAPLAPLAPPERARTPEAPAAAAEQEDNDDGDFGDFAEPPPVSPPAAAADAVAAAAPAAPLLFAEPMALLPAAEVPQAAALFAPSADAFSDFGAALPPSPLPAPLDTQPLDAPEAPPSPPPPPPPPPELQRDLSAPLDFGIFGDAAAFEPQDAPLAPLAPPPQAPALQAPPLQAPAEQAPDADEGSDADCFGDFSGSAPSTPLSDAFAAPAAQGWAGDALAQAPAAAVEAAFADVLAAASAATAAAADDEGDDDGFGDFASPSPAAEDPFAFRAPAPTPFPQAELLAPSGDGVSAFGAAPPASPPRELRRDLSAPLSLNLFGDGDDAFADAAAVEEPGLSLAAFAPAAAAFGVSAAQPPGEPPVACRGAYAAAWARLARAAAGELAAGAGVWRDAAAADAADELAAHPEGALLLSALGAVYLVTALLRAGAARRAAAWAADAAAPECAAALAELAAALADADAAWHADAGAGPLSAAAAAAAPQAAALPLAALLAAAAGAAADAEPESTELCALTLAPLHRFPALVRFAPALCFCSFLASRLTTHLPSLQGVVGYAGGRALAQAANLWAHRVAESPPDFAPPGGDITRFLL